jgi:PIN domain nuclease of toxin-antitoxin system
VRLLVDTHCWLWLNENPERIAEATRRKLESLDNELLLSAASAWEIAIKAAVGKLRLPERVDAYVPSRMRLTGTQSLSILTAHALRVAELPPHHRDPFDRLLVAQAQLEGIPIVTADPQFHPYEVDLIEA